MIPALHKLLAFGVDPEEPADRLGRTHIKSVAGFFKPDYTAGMQTPIFLMAGGMFVASIGLHLFVQRLFPKIGLVDFPHRYGLQRSPIPYPTGCISVLLFCVFLLSFVPLTKQIIGLLVGILLVAVSSFIDDRKQLSPFIRFGIQILAGFIIFGTGTRIYSITNPLQLNGIIALDSFALPFALFENPSVWGALFTIIWLGLTMNALNWFDGISGQVSILSTIGFIVIGLLALSNRVDHINPLMQQQLALFAFVLAGLAAAGAVFDVPPARVLMGDTGAMFFGLLLGVCTIFAGGKVATAFLVLGVPLLDTAIVIVRRILRRKAPWRGSQSGEHLHHRLLECGWSPRQIIVLTASIGGTIGISALFLSTVEKLLAAILLAAIMVILTLYTEVRLQQKR